MRVVLKKLIIFTSLILILTVGMFGCKGDEEQPDDVFDFSISSNFVNLYLGEEYQLEIRDTLEYEVKYQSLDSEVASVSTQGLITAQGEGRTDIKVECNGVTKICTVKVVNSGLLPNIVLENVDDNNVVKLLKSDTLDLTPTIFYMQKKVDAEINFSVSDESVLSIKDNVLTAKTNGSAFITITAQYKKLIAVRHVYVDVVENISVVLKKYSISLATSEIAGQETSYLIEGVEVLKEGLSVSYENLFYTASDEQIVEIKDNEIIAKKIGKCIVEVSTEIDSIKYVAYINVEVVGPYLENPRNICVDSGILCWDKVDFCDYYVVSIDKKQFICENNSVNLYDLLGQEVGYLYGSKDISITACSKNEEILAGKASFSYTFKSVSLENVATAIGTFDVEKVEIQKDFTDANVYKAHCSHYTYINPKDTTPESLGFLGYAFKKVYGTQIAYKQMYYMQSGNGKALIPEGILIDDYYGAEISMWVLAPQDITIRLVEYTASNDKRTALSEKKVVAGKWTKVSFMINRGDYDYITSITTTGDFYFTDLRISALGENKNDYSDCSFSLGYNLQKIIDDLVFSSYDNGVLNTDNVNVLQYEDISLATARYEEYLDKSSLIDYDKFVELKTAFAEKFNVVADMSEPSLIRAYSDTKTDGFRVSSDATHPELLQLTLGFDDAYGKYLNAKLSPKDGGWKVGDITYTHLGIGYTFNDEALFEDCSSVVFYIYNGSESDKRIYADFGGTSVAPYGTFVLKTEQWTKVEVPIDDFLAGTKFGIAYACNGDSAYDYKISAIFAVKENVKINETIKKISLLKTTDFEIYDVYNICAAREYYDSLSQQAKEKIENYNKLVEVESAFNKMYGVVNVEKFISDQIIRQYYDTSSEGVRVNNNTTHPDLIQLSIGTDEQMGNYLSIKAQPKDGSWKIGQITYSHISIKYNYLDLSNSLGTGVLDGCDTVCFYVYNGTDSDNALYADFGGKTVANYNGIQLKSKQWTAVKIPVSDFISGSTFGISYACSGTSVKEYKISGIIGIKDDVKVQAIINDIDTMAQQTLSGDDYFSLYLLNSRYENLSAQSKQKVTNYSKLLQVLKNFNDKYDVIIIDDMTNPKKSTDFDGYVNLMVSSEQNDKYGKVAKLISTKAHNVAIDINACEQDLSGYKVCVSIYNGSSTNKNAIFKYTIHGDHVSYYQPLMNAESWNSLEMSYEDLFSHSSVARIGIKDCVAGDTYYISPIYAIKEK